MRGDRLEWRSEARRALQGARYGHVMAQSLDPIGGTLFAGEIKHNAMQLTVEAVAPRSAMPAKIVTGPRFYAGRLSIWPNGCR